MSSYSSTLHALDAREVPDPWVQTWNDHLYAPLNIAALAGVAQWSVDGGAPTARLVTVGASTTTLVWESGDHDTPGIMAGVATVTNGIITIVDGQASITGDTVTYKRSFHRVILPPRGGAVT